MANIPLFRRLSCFAFDLGSVEYIINISYIKGNKLYSCANWTCVCDLEVTVRERWYEVVFSVVEFQFYKTAINEFS